MAEDKNKKTKKTKSGGENIFMRFLSSLFEQGINKYTRPMVEKLVNNLPDGVVQSVKKLGLDKMLSALSVAFSTIIPEGKIPFGDKINDIIKELSAEIEAAINMKAEGKLSTPGEDKGGRSGKDKIAGFFIDPEFTNEFSALFTAYAELLQDKDGQEVSKEQREKIDLFLGRMDKVNLYLFLRLDKAERIKIIDRFVEKVDPKKETSIEDSIKEIKAQIDKAKEVYNKNIKPKIIEIDEHLSDDSEIGKTALDLVSWSEKLKRRAKKFERKCGR